MATKTEVLSNYELDTSVTEIFDVRKALGKGAYGIVWRAVDKRKKDTVALKKIFDAFRDTTDAQRTYREVVFLRAFRHHPNIIRLLGIYRATNDMDFYLVFEHMESDLHFVIRKGDILKDIHRQFVMYQLVNAMKYVHSGNVIHRDLKPSNILIDSKCRLKVGDFGLARTIVAKPSSSNSNSNIGDGDANGNQETTENDGVMSDYVATRWYRAPEILVGCRKYTKAVDMWSLGCVLGEMITQQAIFQGTSTLNQMERILSALPNVTQREIDNIGTRFGTSLLSRTIRRDYQHSLNAMFRGSSSNEIDFATSLLMLDPKDRLSANKALKHPFVSSFRCPSAELEMRLNVKPPLRDDFRFELNDYRNGLYSMISTELTTSHRGSRSHHSSARRDLPIGVRISSETTLRKKIELEPNALALNSMDPPLQKHSHSHTQEKIQTQVHALDHKHNPQHCGSKRQPRSPPTLPIPKSEGVRTSHKGHRTHSRVTPKLEWGERPVAVTTPRMAAQAQLKERIEAHARAFLEGRNAGNKKTQGIELGPSQTDWVDKLNPTIIPETLEAKKARAKERSAKQKAKAEARAVAKAEARAVAKAEAKAEAQAQARAEAKAVAKAEAKAEAKVEAKAEPKIVPAIATQESIIQKESKSVKEPVQNQNQIQKKMMEREEVLLDANSRSEAKAEPKIVPAISTQEPIIQKESQRVEEPVQKQNQIQWKVMKREEELQDANSRSEAKAKAKAEPKRVPAIATQEPIIQKESQRVEEPVQNQNQHPDQKKVTKREEELLDANSRSDVTQPRAQKSLLLQALLRQKQRRMASQSVELDARVHANLDTLQAQRQKMQKKIIKYAADTGLTFITDTSKRNAWDDSDDSSSTSSHSSDSEHYFMRQPRKSLVPKPQFKCHLYTKQHGNRIMDLHESTATSNTLKKQQQQQQHSDDVFDESERKPQVDNAKDLMVEKYRKSHGKSFNELDNTRTTPGKQQTDLKVDTTAALFSTQNKLKEPRRRKNISGAYCQPLQQRHDIQEVARINANHD
ncbi:mitogen-activated protein kinase 15 [Drosophila subobscura]|uniref:mitogen-activated protein kinase 15 n=1 Tax=Drosophila subobscura TaxID=7241 RepID=UPI00155A284E|nr:mitogen-activated protein kinase 15 [Drosophila subobscura]